jgi:uncharacterized ubiquitin-like protein YukD
MPEDTERGTNIHGGVAKLTQIGIVKGNVLIVSERAVREALPRSLQSPVAQDVTDYIKVVVKSNRFGRKVQFQVPHDMTVGAFIDLVVDVLQLPWSKTIDELMISFNFSYSVVFGDKKLPLNQSLRDAGISDGDEVQLSITAIWTDEIEKQEEEMKKDVEYCLTYCLTAKPLQKQAEIMQKHENARKARGTLTQSKIKVLADSCFAFVDKIGT